MAAFPLFLLIKLQQDHVLKQSFVNDGKAPSQPVKYFSQSSYAGDNSGGGTTC